MKSRRWVLARRPGGALSEDDFALQTVEVSPPADGEALAVARWMSFEPAMRGWLDDDPDRFGRTDGVPSAGYGVQVAVGEVMKGPVAIEVVESRRADLSPGDVVRGMFGWQETMTIGPDAAFARLDPSTPLPLALGVLGGNGLTAYFGMLRVGGIQPKSTVVVSGAAGIVGSVAGQIARIHGCRVIGVAGGAEKCSWLLDECRFDEVIDYKSEDVAKRMRELCGDAIDVFFDNVGGEVLEAAIANMAVHGRIVLCGLVSGYDTTAKQPGPRNLFHLIARRVSMEGFLLSDFLNEAADASQALREWEATGEIAHREDVQEGFEKAPQTFLRLFSGQNRGKQLLRI